MKSRSEVHTKKERIRYLVAKPSLRNTKNMINPVKKSNQFTSNSGIGSTFSIFPMGGWFVAHMKPTLFAGCSRFTACLPVRRMLPRSLHACLFAECSSKFTACLPVRRVLSRSLHACSVRRMLPCSLHACLFAGCSPVHCMTACPQIAPPVHCMPACPQDALTPRSRTAPAASEQAPDILPCA